MAYIKGHFNDSCKRKLLLSARGWEHADVARGQEGGHQPAVTQHSWTQADL